MTRSARVRWVRFGALALALAAIPGRALVAAEAVGGRAQLATFRPSQASSGPFRPTYAPSLDGSPVEYLIVTSEAMAPEFARLAAWKTAKGVPAVVRTLADVDAGAVHGCDYAETLRNYIRDAYQLWGVRFVLLGGDTDIIPARTVGMKLLDFDLPISELYYSCLDGTWNADGDALFGEPPQGTGSVGDDADFFAEVYLGRAPVSTATEAALFVDKTLRYEQPDLHDFQNKILLLAEVLFPTDYDPSGPPPSTDGALFAEEIAALLPAGMQAQKLYEAVSLWPGSAPLTRLGATQAIDAGFGTVVHIGHGYRYTLSCGDGSLDVGDAADFVNGSRAGLFYLLNCTATAFDFESLAEAVLLNPAGGGTAVVGAAREAFPVSARTYQRAFFEQLYTLGERRVGVAMTRSRHRFLTPFLPAVERWTQLVYTLLGDPELPIWANSQPMQVDGVPATLHVGPQEVTLLVRDGHGPLAGARVCLSKSDDEYRVAQTDANGNVVVVVEPGTTGTLDVTVTQFDHLPFRTTVPVTLAGAGLTVAGIDVQDDGGGSGVGNRDGRLDAGETATLRLVLRNAGSSTRSGIVATLAAVDSEATIVQGTSAYPDLAPGAQGSGVSPFVVRLAPGVADGGVVNLTLTVQHAAGTEAHRVELLVRSAAVVLAGLRLDDARAGDGDGVQDPGETIDLIYRLENRGGGTAQQVSLSLSTAIPELEILVDSVTVPDILPGAAVESAAALVVREPDTLTARSAQLCTRHLQNRSGSVVGFDLRRPGPPSGLRFASTEVVDAIHLAWNPNVESDRMGYHVFRADTPAGPFVRVDTDILLHSTYRDVGLAPSRRYAYRVTALDRSFMESAPSAILAVSTNPPLQGGWPVDANAFTASTPGVADVDGDGRLDVIGAANYVMAWDAHGIELRDADRNALTWGVFYGHKEVFGSVALGDLDRAPGREIVVATWDALARYVIVLNGRGEPLPGWPQALLPASDALRGAQVPPVIANLDDTGAPEILLAARDGRLYGWHADGSEIADGDAQPATSGVLFDTQSLFLRSAPGVADLDPTRPGQEIVFGSTDGKLYVLDSRGRALPGWPRTSPTGGEAFGALFAGGICIADLDRDAQREMIFVESMGRLHVLHLDGTELPGFPVSGIVAASNTVVPSPALADLQGDGNLEIVVGGSDGRVHMFDARGTALLPVPLVSGAASECSPLLGDVDGDGGIEVLFGNENGLLQAWNLDGTLVDGFPLYLGAELRATPTLEDVDGDGMAELLVQSWDGRVSLWDLRVPWEPALFPWPTHRGSIHRTGEFGFVVPTPVALSDLQGVYESGRGVWLTWRSDDDAEATARRWRVRRCGPMDSPPVTGTWEPMAAVVAELRGGGELRWLDADASAGAWYGYVIEAYEAGGPRVVGTLGVFAATTATLRLHGAVPNPFNPHTRLAFELPIGAGFDAVMPVRLDVIDPRGRVVATLVHRSLRPGLHTVTWDGRDATGREAPSGVYWARLTAGAAAVTRKLTLLR